MTTVPTDSPSIFASLNKLVMAPAHLAIVRPDNPPPGIAGFIFAVVEDDAAELESDITDHYTEENNSIQDHIGLRPETVTISGSVAEVVLAAPKLLRATEANNPLPLIEGYIPTLAPRATAVQDQVVATLASEQAAVTSTDSLFGFYLDRLKQQPNQTKQQVAYGYLYQLWKGRQLFSVETPWGFFTNMAIQSVSAHQGPNSGFISDFTITFKKIRTIRSLTINQGFIAGRATFQLAPVTQNGTIGQTKPTTAQFTKFYQEIRP